MEYRIRLEQYRSKNRPSRAVDDNSMDFEFVIQPNLSSELYLKNCNLYVDMAVQTLAGEDFPASKQISCHQAIGVLGWASVTCSLNGKPLWKNYQFSNHFAYIKMMTSFDDAQKNSLLWQSGWRSDTVGKSDSENYDSDPGKIVMYIANYH